MAMQDSVSLDLAYLKGEVPATIRTMASDALQEVENARDDTERRGNRVVPGKIG